MASIPDKFVTYGGTANTFANTRGIYAGVQLISVAGFLEGGGLANTIEVDDAYYPTKEEKLISRIRKKLKDKSYVRG